MEGAAGWRGGKKRGSQAGQRKRETEKEREETEEEILLRSDSPPGFFLSVDVSAQILYTGA